MMAKSETSRIGCAGWSIPKNEAAHFSSQGSHLARYSKVFSAVEINSSFYRPHRPTTYALWAKSVPAKFRFAVKLPKQITHAQQLCEAREPLVRFFFEIAHLGEHLGPVLVQLPPKLSFNSKVVHHFFKVLREQFSGAIACEPRHPSWFESAAEDMLSDYGIARVAAHPAIVTAAATPGGGQDLIYYRLHGSPRTYYSSYDAAHLKDLTATLQRHQRSSNNVWCIFDNTALGAATPNALQVLAELKRSRPRRTPPAV